MVDKDIHLHMDKDGVITNKESEERLKKMLPSLIDFTYESFDEGMRRIVSLVELIVSHTSNIAVNDVKADPYCALRNASKDHVFVFNQYNLKTNELIQNVIKIIIDTNKISTRAQINAFMKDVTESK